MMYIISEFVQPQPVLADSWWPKCCMQSYGCTTTLLSAAYSTTLASILAADYIYSIIRLKTTSQNEKKGIDNSKQ